MPITMKNSQLEELVVHPVVDVLSPQQRSSGQQVPPTCNVKQAVGDKTKEAPFQTPTTDLL